MRKNQILFFSAIALVLTACGGGGSGGSNTISDNADTSYTGNRTLATINASNAGNFVELIETYAELEDSPALRNPQPATQSAQGQQTLLTTLTRMALRKNIANRTVNLTQNCPKGGSFQSTGEVDDTTRTGTVTLQFNACDGLEGDEAIYNGRSVVTIRQYNFDLDEPVDQTTAFHALIRTDRAGVRTTLTGQIRESALVANRMITVTTKRSKLHASVTYNNLSYQHLVDLMSTIDEVESSYMMSGTIYDGEHGKAELLTIEDFKNGAYEVELKSNNSVTVEKVNTGNVNPTTRESIYSISVYDAEGSRIFYSVDD